MKKLLLTSLFIMGATAFANTGSGQTTATQKNQASMSILVNGSVIKPTVDDLVIEVKDHNNQNNTGMYFDLGEIIAGSKATGGTPGSFIVRRAKDGKILTNTGDHLIIGLVSEKESKGQSTSTAVKPQIKVDIKTSKFDTNGTEKIDQKAHVHLVYDLTTQKTENEIKGTIKLSAIVDKESQDGRFSDNTVYLYVYADK